MHSNDPDPSRSSARATGASTPEGSPAPRNGDGIAAGPPSPVEVSFHQFAESLSDLVWSARPDGETDYYNGRFLEYLGRTLDQMQGWAWAETLHPDDAERARRAWSEAMASGVDYEAEFRIRRHDGMYRWHRSHGTPMRDQEGRITRWFGTCIDIDDRNAAEQEARRRDRLLRSITDNATTAIFLMDAEGRTTFMNPAAEQMTGYAFREVEGSVLHDRVHHHRPDGTPFPREHCPIADHVMRLAVLRGHEDVFIRKDGTPFPVRCAARPILDGGTLAGIVLEVQDITEERRAEQQVRESEQRFRALMEQAPFSVQVFSPDGRTQRVNRAWEELWGISIDQVADYNILEDRQLEAKGVLGYIRRAFAGEPTAVPAIRYDPNETIPDRSRHEDPRRWVSAVAYPLTDASGRVREVVLVHEDITERRRAEEALRASEAQYRAVYDQAAVGIAEVDLSGRFLRANGRYCEIVGYAQDELVRLRFHDITHPDDPPGNLEKFARIAEGTPSYTIEKRYIRKDGRAVWAHTAVSLIRDGSGRPERVVAVVEDVTDQRRVEQALRESEERFRASVDQAAVGVALVGLDHRTLFVNRGLCQMLGYTEAEMLAKSFVEVTHPDDLAADFEQMRRMMAGEVDSCRYEKRYLHRDGSVVWADLSVAAVRDGREEIQYAVGVLVDVTERRRAAEALRESQANAALALRVARLGTWGWEPPSGLVDADARCREICGLDPAASLTFDEVAPRVHPEDWPRVESALGRALRPDGDGAYAEEFRLVHDDGSVWWVVSHGQTVFEESGGERRPIRMIGTVLDVTERRRLEDEQRRLAAGLAEADRRKDQFLATLAHELRNPLAPIRTALRLMREPAADPDGHEAERAMAERQVLHLARLVDDLMDVARISRGKIALRTQAVELSAVVGQAVEAARALSDERGHRLTVSLPREPIGLEADPTRLEQVVWNLLNNAAKYTEPGGEIGVSVEAGGGEVAIRVRDTGIGIERSMLPRIFEMFAQAEAGSSRAQGGLGIGLGLVRSLVELHGGTIEARSAGPGTGSEFVVRLPVLPASPPERAAPKANAGEAALPRRRVLVVDDNVDAAQSLARLLTRLYGQQVQSAHDGPSGLAAAEAFRPEVILLDIGLPGMDGHEVARRLRARPEFAAAILVALTGWGQESDRQRSREAGFDHHLVKPVDPETLREVLAGGPRRGR